MDKLTRNTRNGLLLFPIGSSQNLEGIPTNTEKWEVRDLGVELKPNKWYKMTITSDFEKREFASFRLEGEGIDVTEDISGFPLKYPNYIPINKLALTFYPFALREEFAPTNEGGTKVHFDDIEGGVFQDN